MTIRLTVGHDFLHCKSEIARKFAKRHESIEKWTKMEYSFDKNFKEVNMKELSYVQRYFICAVNEKGKIPTLNGMSVAACFVIGELTELVSRGYLIWDEKNRLSIVRPFDDGLSYLKPLYETIAYFKKSQEVVRIVDMYVSNVRLPGNYRKSLNNLLTPIGNSLAEIGYVSEISQKRLIYKKNKYAPKPEIVAYVIEEIRLVFLENNVVTNETLCLAVLLDKSDVIHKYFNKNEATLLKKRIAEARESTEYASIRNTLDCIDGVTKILPTLNWG